MVKKQIPKKSVTLVKHEKQLNQTSEEKATDKSFLYECRTTFMKVKNRYEREEGHKENIQWESYREKH